MQLPAWSVNRNQFITKSCAARALRQAFSASEAANHTHTMGCHHSR